MLDSWVIIVVGMLLVGCLCLLAYDAGYQKAMKWNIEYDRKRAEERR